MRLLLIIVLLGLTACNSAWDKDPFKNDSDNVANGQKQGTADKATPPLQSVVFINLEPFYELKEGKKLIIETGYRITHPEFKFIDFVINDLEANFPGAEFDKTTNEISWTPTEDYVPAGAIVYRNPLTVSVFVEYKGLTHEIRKSTSINVLRGDANAPYIEAIDEIDDLTEGTIKRFKISVKDEVSPDGPTLSVRNRGSSNNGAAYIFHDVAGTKNSSDPSLWEFDASIDLSKTPEITDHYKDFTVGFTAHSVFGAVSNVNTLSFRVLTDIVEPKLFDNKQQVFKKGTLNTFKFTFIDTKQEGIVEGQFVTDCSREPVAGANCFCDRRNFHSSCTISWVPPKEGTFEFEIKATNSMSTFAINETKERTEKIVIKVEE